jgi:hypothetical protein
VLIFVAQMRSNTSVMQIFKLPIPKAFQRAKECPNRTIPPKVTNFAVTAYPYTLTRTHTVLKNALAKTHSKDRQRHGFDVQSCRDTKAIHLIPCAVDSAAPLDVAGMLSGASADWLTK